MLKPAGERSLNSFSDLIHRFPCLTGIAAFLGKSILLKLKGLSLISLISRRLRGLLFLHRHNINIIGIPLPGLA